MTYEPYPGGGGPGGYQPYPGGAQMPPAQRSPAPPSVINAVRLMYAGAAVSAIGAIIGLATIGSLKTTLQQQNPSLSSSQINTAADVAVVAVVVVGLIGIGLWIWMALMCKAGKNWARITGTVFFGIATISTLFGLARPEVAVSRIISIVGWLIGLGAVILLWQKASSAFFKPDQYPPNAPWQS
jgi:hypothetical protein